jgi:hypothetical protein
MQVCTVAAGHAAAISSPSLGSPSQHTMITSSRPRLRICAIAWAHALAPSAGPTQIPSTCLIASQSTSIAVFTALFPTLPPSRTFATSASTYTG